MKSLASITIKAAGWASVAALIILAAGWAKVFLS